MAYPIPTVAALAVGPSGRVLVVRTAKWQGLWGVPGGKIEYGEAMEAALLREFQEEVGLALIEPRFALLQEMIEDPAFYKPAHFILINYFARTKEEAVRPNEEILEWAWVTPKAALDYPLNVYTRRLVEAYREARPYG